MLKIVDSSSPPVIQAKPDSEQFSNNNVTVVIELTNKTRPKAPYVVTVVPREEEMQYAQLIIGSEDTEIQLTVLYNVQYNVSVTAIICGHRHESSNKIALHYGEDIHDRLHKIHFAVVLTNFGYFFYS